MNPETLHDLNFSSELRHPSIPMTDAVRERLAAATQRLFGLPGMKIEFPAEDVVRIRKKHSEGEETLFEFHKDHIQIEHADAREHRFDSYKKIVEGVTKIGIETAGIPFVFEQRHTVSKTLSMRSNADSRPFLAENVAKFSEGELAGLGKRLGGIGLRFFFPPDDTRGILSEYDLKIESYLPDYRRMFLLAKGRFLCIPPITGGNLENVLTALEEVEKIITIRAINFLEQFQNRKELP